MYFQGQVAGIHDSAVGISTCDGIKGVIQIGKHFYEIDNDDGKDHFLITYKTITQFVIESFTKRRLYFLE
jgi:hypothetical protein